MWITVVLNMITDIMSTVIVDMLKTEAVSINIVKIEGTVRVDGTDMELLRSKKL